MFLIFFQISIGAFVSGMDAGRIYNSWPLMGSSYFPNDSSYIDLFKLSAFDEPSLFNLYIEIWLISFVYIIYIYFSVFTKKKYLIYISLLN